ncbi:XRE family transcriptional regulator [Photobacterium damselae subsp. damselae]|uniref:Helix-turn-helix transcriptional regulator n=2 Tax=Photobacterium damselae TaxID=38293 RepID=A0AAD3ZVN6_PHODD|nr:helix-turn-helix transcriptional regulator [Photobacterium damselae subsp. damselae]KAB1180886.1 helix-turn-helix transcriptional regulator [Photobacterium damselae subsp. damselae]PSB79786.1 XRE family transcriptional regulator [Photobacterium damselae subsp. damselae]PSB86088.1 XRE family transcriptional regulator [Photobacterium damselae subsp. damselae]
MSIHQYNGTTMPNYFSLILTSLRTQKGFTQIEMSKKLGLARQTYQDYESGKREPRYTTIIKCAHLLEVSPSLFFKTTPQDSINERLRHLSNEKLIQEVNRRLISVLPATN